MASTRLRYAQMTHIWTVRVLIGSGPTSVGAQCVDDRDGFAEQADGTTVIVIDAAAGAVAPADNDYPGPQSHLELVGQPADETAVVEPGGEVKGEDPEVLGGFMRVGEWDQAAPALVVADHGQCVAGERGRLIDGELFKAPDAVVHDDVGSGDHPARPLFGLLRGLLADADHRGYLLISPGTGPLPGIRAARRGSGQQAALPAPASLSAPGCCL